MPDDTSLREDLVAAFRETSDSGNTDTQGAEPTTASKELSPQSEPSASAKPESGKPAAAAPASPASPATPAASAPEKPIEPPARWDREAKEQFAALDPAIQKILLTRNKSLEADYTRKATEIAQERQRFHALEQVLAPRREGWQRQGMNDAQFLNSVMSYWDMAQRDPMQFINQFARERGIDLAALYAPTAEEIAAYFADGTGANGGPNAELGAVHPAVRAQLDALKQQQAQLAQSVTAQQHYTAQQQQQWHAALRQEASSEIQQFASATDEHGNPRHAFFEDVRADMVKLMQAGIANTLSDAYDRAVYMRADVRSKIEESREIQRRREEQKRIQEEAAKAKRAGASVSASSSTYSPQSSGDDDEDISIRSLISKQFERARVGSRL